MDALPIDAHLDDLLGQLESAGSLIVVAQPGTGKTTRLPPAIALDGRVPGGRVVVTQPRRLAAIGTARRVADERGSALGEEVGYRVRFERRSSSRTPLEYVTTGTLLRQLQRDPFLAGVGTVVLDEFHERSLELDLSLALLRDLRASGRDDLRVVVLSATLDPEPIAAFLGHAAVAQLAGRNFPVDVAFDESIDERPLPQRIARTVVEEAAHNDGNVLVFLPGLSEIRKAREALDAARAAHGLDVVELHGSLELERQRAALRPSPRRRVWLATNVAETSLTLPDVRVVVDSGLERLPLHDPARGFDRLLTQPISRWSAEQRAGRAGRTAPGRARRLWTRVEHTRRAASRPPEIQRVDLLPLVLELGSWGAPDPQRFALLEQPSAAAWEQALSRGRAIGAIDGETGAVSELGRRLLDLPVAPRIGRLLLACSERGEHRAGCELAALLESPEILEQPRSRARERSVDCDLLERWRLLRAAVSDGGDSRAAASRGLRAGTVRTVLRLARDLERRLPKDASAPKMDPKESQEHRLRRALLLAWADRVVLRRAESPRRGRMVGGSGVRLAETSAVSEGAWFLALALMEGDGAERRESRVTWACAIDPEWLEEFFPHAIQHRVRAWFDEDAGRVRAESERCYLDLPLGPGRNVPADGDRARELVGEALAQKLPGVLAGEASLRTLQARARIVCELLDPDRTDPALAVPDGAVFAQRLALQLDPRAPLPPLDESLEPQLRRLLPPAALAVLDRWTPTHWELPNGRRARIDYRDDGPPILAARVQDFFGLEETPRIGGGRIPLLLHLLAPNGRPVQITDDLRSFWDRTYAQVRKDLRGRYPKHRWPEDPRAPAASDQRGGSSRRSSSGSSSSKRSR